MPASIRQTDDSDVAAVKELLRLSYSRSNEADFFEAIRHTDTYIPGLSLVAEYENDITGFILLTRIGIRTANEILPALTMQPFCVREEKRGEGVGRMLLEEALQRAGENGYTSCITLQCGEYFKHFGFLPAREQFGLELYFDIEDGEFRAFEIEEDALYRKSGFLIFPSEFSHIDPVIIS